MDLYKINPNLIATECSSVHIENVIKDLVLALRDAETLANEVLTLNSSCGELGEGKALELQAWAKRVKHKIGNPALNEL